jgi:hypothetical protein
VDIATLPTICAKCKTDGLLKVSQSIKNNRLVWVETFRCQCGHGFEAGDASTPPAAVRQALLDQTGTFEVWVDDTKARPAALKVMTSMLHLKEAEAAFRLVQFPVRLFTGTKAEADFIAMMLERFGATAARIEHRGFTPKPST